MNKPNVIVCAAQQNINLDIIASPRHCGLTHKLIPLLKSNWNTENLNINGFLDKCGKFHSMSNAYKIAKYNNQLLYNSNNNNKILTSENLYSFEGKPVIVCAANYHIEMDIFVCGIRHYDSIMRKTISQFKEDYRDAWYAHDNVIQGFIDQYEKFYTREEALELAASNNQIKYRCGGDDIRLFSENLY